LPVSSAERVEKAAKCAHLVLGHFQAHQHATEVSLVAVVEEAHVPVGADTEEKSHERSWSLGELAPVEKLVVGQRGVAADEMAHVELRELVFG
jgi:hypothetical protein